MHHESEAKKSDFSVFTGSIGEAVYDGVVPNQASESLQAVAHCDRYSASDVRSVRTTTVVCRTVMRDPAYLLRPYPSGSSLDTGVGSHFFDRKIPNFYLCCWLYFTRKPHIKICFVHYNSSSQISTWNTSSLLLVTSIFFLYHI